MDNGFLWQLEILRSRVGFPLIVTSGYRCPEHNQRCSSTGLNGPHTTGRAVDFKVDGNKAFVVVRSAMLTLDFTGIGVQQKGQNRFIHLDNLPNAPGRLRPTIWSY
jgi:uncharacterized protein YcbK (DUF882 family)